MPVDNGVSFCGFETSSFNSQDSQIQRVINNLYVRLHILERQNEDIKELLSKVLKELKETK